MHQGHGKQNQFCLQMSPPWWPPMLSDPSVQCALFVHAHNKATNHLFIGYPLIFLAIRTLYFMVGFDHAGQRTSHFVRASV